jgi:hypothetical protein
MMTSSGSTTTFRSARGCTCTDSARDGLCAARAERCAPDSHEPQNWTVAAVRGESLCLTVPALGSLLSGAHLPALACQLYALVRITPESLVDPEPLSPRSPIQLRGRSGCAPASSDPGTVTVRHALSSRTAATVQFRGSCAAGAHPRQPSLRAKPGRLIPISTLLSAPPATLFAQVSHTPPTSRRPTRPPRQQESQDHAAQPRRASTAGTG